MILPEVGRSEIDEHDFERVDKGLFDSISLREGQWRRQPRLGFKQTAVPHHIRLSGDHVEQAIRGDF